MKQTRDPRSRQQKFLKYFSLFVYLSLVASIIYIVVRIFWRRLLCQPGLLKTNG